MKGIIQLMEEVGAKEGFTHATNDCCAMCGFNLGMFPSANFCSGCGRPISEMYEHLTGHPPNLPATKPNEKFADRTDSSGGQ